MPLGQPPSTSSDNSPPGRQYLTGISPVSGKCSTSLHHCLHRAPLAAVPFVKRLKIHFVRGLILSAWIRLDRARLTTLTVVLPSALQGLYFSSLWKLGRSRVTALPDKQSLSRALAAPHISRKSGVKQEGLPGVNPPPVFSTAKQESKQVKIWDATRVPKPYSYLDINLSLQSKVFKSVALFYLPALRLPSPANR